MPEDLSVRRVCALLFRGKLKKVQHRKLDTIIRKDLGNVPPHANTHLTASSKIRSPVVESWYSNHKVLSPDRQTYFIFLRIRLSDHLHRFPAIEGWDTVAKPY